MTARERRIAHAGRAVLALVLTFASAAGFSVGRATRTSDDIAFPHARHAKLFPACVGCHAGISSGDSATMFPPAASCTECHNGRDVKLALWTYPSFHPTNLRFDHARHARLSDSAGTHLDCLKCHGVEPSPQWMMVARARPETCIGCHAHPAPSHLAESSRCMTCHVPLTRATALSETTIAKFPSPSSHAEPDFITAHGGLAARSAATCATCHARESCARCHVNAATLGPIAALASDARVARIVADKPAVYPVPPSHRLTDFATVHGALARANIQTCATCHAQPSCLVCHTGPLGARVIDALPLAGAGHAPGVQLLPPRAAPPPAWPPGSAAAPVVSVHPLDIVRTHGPIAASGRLNCAGCHQQRFCSSCHQPAGERRYHPLNFVARHASEAYARETKCVSCHNTEVFCRSCHRDVGIGAGSNRRSGTAHAGQPLWLLQHGEAARRGMPSCASCHQQTDCMQCHSAFGSRVNPHGPDFDAKTMQKRNPTLCSYCHIGPPR